MNGNEIVDLARRTYLEELAQFIVGQAKLFDAGAAEVALMRHDLPNLFGAHYRADFVGQRGKDAVPIDLTPDRRLQLETPLQGAAGPMRVTMESLVWDDVEISHDAPGNLTLRLKPWFAQWYDPNDQRKPAQPGGLVDVIHSLGVRPGQLLVDFGSASTGAFWSLAALLRDTGATAITIRETRPRPQA